jgi:predicted permease
MTILRRLWFFVTRWRRLSEIDEEMRVHVDLRAAANRRSGLDTDEAARQARVRFGNRLALREDARDAWGFAEVERITGDLRQAIRRVMHQPSRTLIVVVTLALGIGAATAMFTLLDAMLFKPAPWDSRGEGKLVWIAGLRGHSTGTGNVSYPDYLVYRDRATTLSGVMAYGGTAMSIGGRQPKRVLGGLVSGNYFDLISVGAQVGRTIRPDEDGQPGAHPVVLLSDALWRSHFGADPQVIGTVVAINGHPFTIIGVAARGFTGVTFATDPEELWVPMAMLPVVMPDRPELLARPNEGWLRAVGRLRDDTTTTQADAEMRLIARALNPPGTAADQAKSARLFAIRGGLTPWEQDELTPIFALISIVPALVLLVACANVANVLMAHHVARRREFAMRRAIGASRGRLIRQLLAESLVVSVLAGLAGFAVSFGLSAVIAHYGDVPPEVDGLLAPSVRALVAATAIGVVTVLMFGLAPAVTATRFDVLPTLKDEGTTSTASHGQTGLRRAFVIAQVALSLTLLIAAGLFLKSLSRAMVVDPGFDPAPLVTVSFDLNLQGYTPERRSAFAAQFLERSSALPGVTSVAVANILPFGGEMYGSTIASEDGASFARASFASISPDYFKTLAIPVVRGREFTQADVAANAQVAILNETVARAMWPGVDPIGKRVRDIAAKESWREVIGVTRDTKFLKLTEGTRGAYYVPLRTPDASFVVRTTDTPAAALLALTEAVRDLDPHLPIARAQTMNERVRNSVRLQRAVVSLLTVLGGMTLLLASVGIYGVAAHSVSMRTREVGIRISLGARASDVLRMIVRENVWLTLIGVAVGLGLSVAGSMLLASFLFGVAPTDAATFTTGAVILFMVSVAASYIPARRAARLDPLMALRRE